MRRSLIIGLAIGTALGAVAVESFPPAKELADKSKQKIKNKLEQLNH